MPDPLRILVVDDDHMQLDLVSRTLKGETFEVMVCDSPIGVTNAVRSFAPDVVLMDVNIPALSGDRLLTIARKNAPKTTRFVLYSSADESRLRALSLEIEADGWIPKSVTGDDLIARVREIAANPPLNPNR